MISDMQFQDGIHLQLSELLGASLPRFQLVKSKRKLPSMATLNGQTRSRFRGQGMEFEEVRAYLPGDDIRNIDWRVTARTGTTHTKVFTEDKEQLVFGILNQQQRLFFGSKKALKSVIAAHYFANILNQARDQGHRVGAFLFDDHNHREFKPSNRRKHLMHILSDVEKNHNLQIEQIKTSGFETQQHQGDNLSATLQRLTKIARPGSKIHIISDLLPDADKIWESISLLARHNQLQIWCIIDILDWFIPSANELTISDGNQKKTLWFSKNRSQQYQNDFLTKIQNMQNKVWQSGAELHLLGSLPNQLETHTKPHATN